MTTAMAADIEREGVLYRGRLVKDSDGTLAVLVTGAGAHLYTLARQRKRMVCEACRAVQEPGSRTFRTLNGNLSHRMWRFCRRCVVVLDATDRLHYGGDGPGVHP